MFCFVSFEVIAKSFLFNSCFVWLPGTTSGSGHYIVFILCSISFNLFLYNLLILIFDIPFVEWTPLILCVCFPFLSPFLVTESRRWWCWCPGGGISFPVCCVSPFSFAVFTVVFLCVHGWLSLGSPLPSSFPSPPPLVSLSPNYFSPFSVNVY